MPSGPADAFVLRSTAGDPPGITIPTLDEVLTEFPATPCIVEVKDPAAAEAVVAAALGGRQGARG